MQAMQMSRSKMLTVLVIGVVLVILPFFCPSYLVNLFTQIYIYAILAMSLDILVGYTGLPSFGHAAFFGTGAYVVGVMSTRHGAGVWMSGLSAVVVTTGVAAIFGLLCVHSSGVSFMMISLALGMVLWGLAVSWVSMTGGGNGISGIPRPDFGLVLDMSNPLAFYYLVLLVFGLALLGMYLLILSPFGQSLQGIRESESRMRVLGYNTWLHKYLSYVISGVFAGVAGILWAYHNGFVSPGDLDMLATMEALFMVIVGGPGTLIGPAIGSAIMVFLKNFISAFTHRWLMILGSIFVIIILYAPHGLFNAMIHLKEKRKEKIAREET